MVAYLRSTRSAAHRWRVGLSLRLQLAIWYTTLIALALVVFGLSFYFLTAYLLQDAANQIMIRAAGDVAAQVHQQKGQIDRAVAEPIVRNVATRAPGVVVRVVDGQSGQVLAGAGEQSFPLLSDAVGTARRGVAVLETLKVGTESFFVYSLPIDLGGQRVEVVQVARPVTAEDVLLEDVRHLVLAVVALGLPVAGVVGWVLAGRTLTPLQEMAQAAALIGLSRDFSHRLPDRGPKDELGHLATTINTMLAELESAHREIASANARLEQTLAAQQRFVADASHELRTPLTIIRANAELLSWANGNSQDDRARALADLSSEAERMSRLVQDLLTLARADGGQQLSLRPLSLRPVVEETFRQAQILADGHNLTLAASEDVEVSGDADSLKQLLLILLDNAIKYTPRHGQITVSLNRQGDEARLSVADTGIGIATNEVPQIFDRFYRTDESRRVGGSGLGLAIAHWIADQHHARIVVSSTPGQGSTFTVSLRAT